MFDIERDWFAKPFACLLKRCVSPHFVLAFHQHLQIPVLKQDPATFGSQDDPFSSPLGNWHEAYLVIMFHDKFDFCQLAVWEQVPSYGVCSSLDLGAIMCEATTFKKKKNYLYTSILCYFPWRPKNGSWLLLFTVQTDPTNTKFLGNRIF